MTRILTILLISGLCYGSAPLYAQTASHTPSVTINKLATISVTGSAGVTMSNVADYTSGYTQNSFWTVQVDANSAWTVNAKAQSSTWTNSGASSTAGMPSTVLSFRKNGDVNWKTLTTTDQVVSSGTVIGDETATGHTFTVDIKLTPGYDYGPGSYQITLVFTATLQ